MWKNAGHLKLQNCCEVVVDGPWINIYDSQKKNDVYELWLSNCKTIEKSLIINILKIIMVGLFKFM